MAHHNQARVQVCLASVRPPVPKRRPCAARKRDTERRVVHRRILALARAVCRPQVADAVEGVELARAAPVLAQAGRVQRVTVNQDRGAGRGAVADVRVYAGAVRFAHPQAQAVVGVGRARCDHLRQAILVVVSERVQAAVNRDGFLVAVCVPGISLTALRHANRLVVGVAVERLQQRSVDHLG